ncbi:MAG TPA: TIGR02186 family protein [Dissulfurispiraceae bacterium]|nr:TIGR02186 family protein [Dissulfurispiraceae bacterium]
MKYDRLFKRPVILVKLLLLALLCPFADNAYAELTAKANHDHITIDSFYHGSTVSIRGIADPGTDLIIKLSSDDTHHVLRQKGKVGGLLWMTVGELDVDHVPNVYEIHSTRNLSDMLARDEADKYGLGYKALENRAAMNVSGEDRAKWFGEFVKFKESSNLYSTSAGKISLADHEGKQSYYILTQWPYQAPPGNYTVTVYAVRNGRVVETATDHVAVEQIGVVKTLATMARNNAAVYGLLAIMSALAAGLGVGLVFRKQGGAH